MYVQKWGLENSNYECETIKVNSNLYGSPCTSEPVSEYHHCIVEFNFFPILPVPIVFVQCYVDNADSFFDQNGTKTFFHTHDCSGKAHNSGPFSPIILLYLNMFG